jgi:hypothetical protein
MLQRACLCNNLKIFQRGFCEVGQMKQIKKFITLFLIFTLMLSSCSQKITTDVIQRDFTKPRPKSGPVSISESPPPNTGRIGWWTV